MGRVRREIPQRSRSLAADGHVFHLEQEEQRLKATLVDDPAVAFHVRGQLACWENIAQESGAIDEHRVSGWVRGRVA